MTTFPDDIIEVLRGVGFSENEALVYLANLKMGSSSIWDIAKESGVKRPTCYVVLDELVFRGVASKTEGGKAALYSVISPKQLLQRVETRQERFTKKIGELQAIASMSPQKPAVRLFEGIEGVKEAYNLSLDQAKGSELLIYGTSKVLDVEILGEFIAEYLKRRTAKQITVRAILPDTPENRTVTARDTKELRKTRFLPADKFNSNLELNVFSDTLVYIVHSELEPFATVIENGSIAQVQKEQFEYLWQAAKA